jgi:hypothetical protein
VRARTRLAVALAALAPALTAALTACTGHTDGAPEPHWRVVSLPMPPGPTGRIAVREATRCGEGWYVVGGVFLDRPSADQDSRPAAWRSTDGRTWTPMPIEARTFWGQRAILASVACANGTVNVVGARSGGAHGIPRVTTFYEDAEGLHDVEAGYTQYGGENGTNVGPISGGPVGWLITGNRTSGPAVWTSPSGRSYRLHEGVPGLADDDRLTALAQDAAWDGEQWIVVGGGSAPGHSLDRQPQAWTSPDNTAWTREPVPTTPKYDDLERVLVAPRGDVLALGLRGSAFGSWHHRDGVWTKGRTFGRIPSEGGHSPFVASLASDGDGLWTTTSDGVRYTLWHSTDGDRWQRVRTPAATPETGGDHTLSVAAGRAGVLLLSDDGDVGRAWIARPDGA